MQRAIPAKDTEEIRTSRMKCRSFSLLSMPTKLADGLGLRDILLCWFRHTALSVMEINLEISPEFGSSVPGLPIEQSANRQKAELG